MSMILTFARTWGRQGLTLGVEKRGAVRSKRQPPRSVEWLLQREDWDCLAGCKVQEVNSPVWLSFRIDEIDSFMDERPVEPSRRLIQNAGFLATVQWHPPYAWLFSFGIIEEASIIGFDSINATVSCYLDRRSALERYLP